MVAALGPVGARRGSPPPPAPALLGICGLRARLLSRLRSRLRRATRPPKTRRRRRRRLRFSPFLRFPRAATSPRLDGAARRRPSSAAGRPRRRGWGGLAGRRLGLLGGLLWGRRSCDRIRLRPRRRFRHPPPPLARLSPRPPLPLRMRGRRLVTCWRPWRVVASAFPRRRLRTRTWAGTRRGCPPWSSGCRWSGRPASQTRASCSASPPPWPRTISEDTACISTSERAPRETAKRQKRRREWDLGRDLGRARDWARDRARDRALFLLRRLLRPPLPCPFA